MEDAGACDKCQPMLGRRPKHELDGHAGIQIRALPHHAELQNLPVLVRHLHYITSPERVQLPEYRRATGGVEMAKDCRPAPVAGAWTTVVPGHVAPFIWGVYVRSRAELKRLDGCAHSKT